MTCHAAAVTAAAAAAAAVKYSVRPHRWQQTRLPLPWDSPGKNTGVGCHFLLQCMNVKSESEFTQSCPTLSDPWTAALQAPPSMGFTRQEYWSGLPLLSPCSLQLFVQNNPPICSIPKCHYFISIILLRYAAKSLQSCPTLCDPVDGSPPGSPVPGILQARTLEWAAISFSNA